MASLEISLSNDAASPVPILVSLDSDEGIARLNESECSGDFFRLVRFFCPQKNLAFCGVASSVMILNALPIRKPQGGVHGSFPFYTQENYFSAEARAIKPPEEVAESGMSLVELTSILNTHPEVRAECCFASTISLFDFRELAITHLNSDKSYVLVNYLRTGLGQQGGGHISPIGAYHQKSDSFLIMDVSQYKYPPVWVAAKALWQSMFEKVEGSELSRGFVLVRTTQS